MSEIQQSVLRRVRKMIKLAEDAGASEGERDNAMRMVHATLAKYNITLSEVTASEEAQEEPRERGEFAFLGKPWAIKIAGGIAKMCFCYYYYSNIKGQHGPGSKAMHKFVGRRSNVTTAQEMAKFVVESVNREAQRYQRSVNGTYRDYRAFAEGAASKIRHRCFQLEMDAKHNGIQGDADKDAPPAMAAPGTAIAIINLYQGEAKANQEWLVNHGVRLSHARTTKRVDFDKLDAVAAGVEYGNKVSLHRQVGHQNQNLKRIKGEG